jgi:hypothetical protein
MTVLLFLMLSSLLLRRPEHDSVVGEVAQAQSSSHVPLPSSEVAHWCSENTKVCNAVFKYAKGSRPDPSTYLSREQVGSLLSAFKDGASWLVGTAKLDTYGRNLIGAPDDNQFVLPTSVLSRLLASAADCKHNQYNVTVLEQLIGVPAGHWGSRISRIDVPNVKDHNLRCGG